MVALGSNKAVYIKGSQGWVEEWGSGCRMFKWEPFNFFFTGAMLHAFYSPRGLQEQRMAENETCHCDMCLTIDRKSDH